MIRIITIIGTLICFIETFRVAIIYLRDDISLLRKIDESLILIVMILFCYFNIHYGNKIIILLTIILACYIFIKFIKGIYNRSEYIDELSIKNAIDLSKAGIMFLDNKGKIILKNKFMNEVLNNLKINDNYLENLIKLSFKKMDNCYLVKDNDIIWKIVKYNNKEIVLYDVSEIYNLNEEYIKENKLIEENNIKIMKLMDDIERIERAKNLLKIKNEYHDILGHRLVLFNKYMENGNYNVDDLEFLLDRIYDDEVKINPKSKLDNLIKMYNIVGIKINFDGKLTNDEKIDEILFEIIREAVTNAIIHANSDLIDIKIDNNKIVIENNGVVGNKLIKENDGIKGMRRKLSDINGSLDIIVDDTFKLLINIKNRIK